MPGDAGIVEQRINASEFFDDLGDDLLYLLIIGFIQRIAVSVIPVIAEQLSLFTYLILLYIL